MPGHEISPGELKDVVAGQGQMARQAERRYDPASEQSCSNVAGDVIMIADLRLNGYTPEKIKALIRKDARPEDRAQEEKVIDMVFGDHEGDVIDLALHVKELCLNGELHVIQPY